MVRQPAMNFSATGSLTSSRALEGLPLHPVKRAASGLKLGRLIYTNIYLITHMTVIRSVFVGKQV